MAEICREAAPIVKSLEEFTSFVFSHQATAGKLESLGDPKFPKMVDFLWVIYGFKPIGRFNPCSERWQKDSAKLTTLFL